MKNGGNECGRRRRRAAVGLAAASAALAAWDSTRATLLIDVRAVGAGGGGFVLSPKNATLQNAGDTITFNVFARVTGTNGVNDETFNSVSGLLNSVGGLKGNLSGGPIVPFRDSSFSNGSMIDWDSDGDLDIGLSPTHSGSTGKFFARNATSGGYAGLTPVSADAAEVAIGQFIFTATAVPTPASTDVNFTIRNNNGNNVNGGGAALWFEDGQSTSKNTTSTPSSVGVPLHIVGPTVGFWGNTAGGSYQSNPNWYNSAPPGAQDIATFITGNNTYTVTFSANAAAGGVFIGPDHVTFNLGGNSLSLSGSSETPLVVASSAGDSGSLTVTNGSVVTGGAAASARSLVGNGAGAVGTLIVSTGGSWTGAANLTVGQSGNGTVTVQNGGTTTVGGTATQYIGQAAGSQGTVNVTGAGSAMSFTSNSALIVGGSGSGAINVSAGGSLSSAGPIVLADNSASSANVSVGGASSALSTAQGMFVGDGGTATLAVNSGGAVSAASLAVSNGTGSGSVALNSGSALTVSGAVTVNGGGTLGVNGGAHTSGAVTVNSGGAVNVTGGTFAASGNTVLNSGATINASGGTYSTSGNTTINTGSTLTVSGGTYSTGALNVAGGTLNLNSGTFNLSNSNLVVGSGGLFGATMNIGSGMNVTVTQSATVNAGAKISSIGGSFASGASSVNNGTIAITDGALGFTGAASNAAGGRINLIGSTLTTGPALNNAGRINFIDGTINGSVQLSGSGVLNTAGDVTVNGSFGGMSGALIVGEGRTALTPGADKTIAVSSVSVGGGQLDLADNKLIVAGGTVGTWSGSAYTGVTGLLQAGYGGREWDGADGIITSMTDATTSVLTTLAVAEAEEVGYAGGTFGGVSVDAGDVLVMYTWGGDATLDGKLDGDDYFRIDSNISAQNLGFHNGDFDYSGEINGDDYFIIDSNIVYAQASGFVFPTLSGGASLGAVPEPGALAGAALAALLARRRERQQRK